MGSPLKTTAHLPAALDACATSGAFESIVFETAVWTRADASATRWFSSWTADNALFSAGSAGFACASLSNFDVLSNCVFKSVIVTCASFNCASESINLDRHLNPEVVI